MKSAWIAFTALLISLLLGGCARTSNSGTNSGSAAPRPSLSPGISSSADIVKVQPSSIVLPAGGKAQATVTLSIAPGFHVNANPATFAYLIPTEVTPGTVEGITVAKPIYPKAEKKTFMFAKEPLAVYEGEAQIGLPLRAEKNLTLGTHSMPVNITVQACDHEQCFAPTGLKTTVAIEVK
jgi:hypothetical protein